jgi:AraC-like DNA-binding protein
MDKEEVERFTQKVVHWHVDDHFDRTALLAYTYGTLLFHARVWERNKERIELPARLQTTLRLLKDRCTQHAPLREIAKEVGCSLPYLHELVRVHLRTTPHALVLKSRMHMARERLATTDQAVKQIAGDCGFATSAAFCHAFKSRVGLTPLDYRRKQAGP